MNPKAFARQLLENFPNSTHMTIQLIDNDGTLVLRVYQGTQHQVDNQTATLIAESDTGENAITPEIDLLTDCLIDALNEAGVKTTRYLW